MNTTPKDTVDVHVNIRPPVEVAAVALTKAVTDATAASKEFAAYMRTFGRLRRSRQCRGKRSRNYVRALDRTTEAEHTDADLANIVAQAKKSGALANFHREVNRAEDKRQARLRAQAVAAA